MTFGSSNIESVDVEVYGNDGIDIISGSEFALPSELIRGMGDGDIIVCGAGDDTAEGGGGDDTITGGDGEDYLR